MWIRAPLCEYQPVLSGDRGECLYQFWFQMASWTPSDFNHAISAAEHAVSHDSGIGPTESNDRFLIAVVDFYERLGGL
jgi:hypothetical protein